MQEENNVWQGAAHDETRAIILSYRQILQTVGQQLASRSSTIAIRSFLKFLPVIIGFTIGFIGSKLSELYPQDNSPAYLYVVDSIALLLIIITVPWMIIVGHIFKVERIIWIDSVFKNITLSGSQSWKMARGLFWPSMVFDVIVFIRYYLTFYALLALGIFVYIVSIVRGIIQFDIVAVVIGVLVYAGVIIVFSTLMRIKLRYGWFLFIDMRRAGHFSYASLFKELKRLNQTTKSDEYKKLLILSVGADATAAFATTVVGLLTSPLVNSGVEGEEIAGRAIQLAAAEYAAVAKDYAKEVVFYIYYAVARTTLYGQPQAENTYTSAAYKA